MDITIKDIEVCNTPSLKVTVEGHPEYKGVTVTAPKLETRLQVLSEFLEKVFEGET